MTDDRTLRIERTYQAPAEAMAVQVERGRTAGQTKSSRS